ncbi:hypothetical protein X798_02360 [Onchocerca flexuosa]|uniref:Uncharacterized protein n=1 Tax=Onchocerca flexuosa TaxID=387005 RepID=A0A238BZD8_9BILA|nr:hypothetical protein X798_02360 [Onchocerca flexuosa]
MHVFVFARVNYVLFFRLHSGEGRQKVNNRSEALSSQVKEFRWLRVEEVLLQPEQIQKYIRNQPERITKRRSEYGP